MQSKNKNYIRLNDSVIDALRNMKLDSKSMAEMARALNISPQHLNKLLNHTNKCLGVQEETYQKILSGVEKYIKTSGKKNSVNSPKQTANGNKSRINSPGHTVNIENAHVSSSGTYSAEEERAIRASERQKIINEIMDFVGVPDPVKVKIFKKLSKEI